MCIFAPANMYHPFFINHSSFYQSVKQLLTLLLAMVAIVQTNANPDFSAEKKYHIVSQCFPDGCVVDGLTAGVSDTPLYYQSEGNDAEETYWIFSEVQNGCYSIQNAKTKQYITYDGVYSGSGRRYVSMTATIDGNLSLWTVELISDGVYTIRNVEHANHVWDVRTGSYTVGTHEGNDGSNQRFSFYDQNGKQVFERTVDEGFDVSSWFTATMDALDGWTHNGFFMNTSGVYHNGDASIVAPFIETWHEAAKGPLNDCTLQQTLSHLPAGNYRLRADAIAVYQGNKWNNPEEKGRGVMLFASTLQPTYTKTVNVSTNNNTPERYILDFTVSEESDVTFGIKAENTNANWIAIDNILLAFLGTEDELIQGEEAKLRADLKDYLSDDEIEQELATVPRDFKSMEELRKKILSRLSTDPLAQALKNFTIDGHALAYDQSNDLYLCPIPLEQFGNPFSAIINFELRNEWNKVTIGIYTIKDGDVYQFSDINAEKVTTVEVYKSDGTILSKRIQFTSLPVVTLYGSFNNSYSDGYIRVIEPDVLQSELLNMKAKWRGGITNGDDKHKRNYHVKLKDNQGNKLEQKFFGLRKDNSWILESCQVDMSRIRNRIVTDLWNDYSTPPYYFEEEPKAMTGTRGRFVELILNGEYRGIYCMTENIDRKQMKLKKYDEETDEIHGQLWKSKDWSYSTFMGHYTDNTNYPGTSPVGFSNSSDMWDKYQTKYPDFEDIGRSDWQILYNAVDFVCTSSDTQFKQQVGQFFDLPLVIDYYILLETILATDNHGKNMFFACYDKQTSPKITFAIWDLDAVIGQRWSDSYFHQSFMQPEQDYTNYITNYEHGDFNVFRRLRNTNADNFNYKVRLRYRDLRKGFLSTESILDRFRKQLAEFKTAGADKREYAKWNGDSDIAHLNLDFDDELSYIEDWIRRRMRYLDKVRFEIDDLPSAIAQNTIDNHLEICLRDNEVIIFAETAQNISIHTVGGQTIRTLRLQQGENMVGELPAGIYLIGKKKIVIK